MEGANVQPEVGSELSRPPVLNNWFRSQNGINLSLSNGTIQINCFRVCFLLKEILIKND